MSNMTVSLLITTYNWVAALEQVLLSVKEQTCLPKEVVVADDGSGQQTADLIASLQASFPTKLVHCWHEDKGFRAAAIRNKAIAEMTADYVVMIDGDMVLHPSFIQDHLCSASKGSFIQGSRVITSPAAADRLLSGQKSMHFLSSGISNRFNALRLPLLSSLVSACDESIHGTKTCNFSAWRSDLIDINGFDESYVGWGREDSDLVARLFHSGKHRLKLKLMANAYHLYHAENSRGSLSCNDTLLTNCIKEKTTWCVNGIDKHLENKELKSD